MATKKGTDFWLLPWLPFCRACSLWLHKGVRTCCFWQPSFAAGIWTSWHTTVLPQGVMLQGTVTWTKSETVRQLHYFRMQYQSLWRWWSLAEDVLGEGAVTGPQYMLSKYSGCHWKDLCNHSLIWFSMLELDTLNNLGRLGLLELLIFDGNWFKLKDVETGGLSDARWIWESSWCFPEPSVCAASVQEDKAMMVYPVDCHAKASKAELGLVAISRSLPL